MIPRDASRATIFALGLTLAGQACGGKTEVDDNGPPGSAASTGINSGSGGTGGGVGGGSSFAPETCADNPLLRGCPLDYNGASATPPYGGTPYVVPPGSAGSAGSTGMAGSDGAAGTGAALDAGAEDAGGGDAAPDEDAGN